MWRMRIAVIGSICAAFLNIGAAMAMPVDMDVGRLLEICEAPDISTAAQKGDELGWQRQTADETKDWRTSFLAYNGGSVEVVGWRREQGGDAESLSFWVAVGPNGHKACAYSTARPADFLDGLSERLGAPDSFERNEAAESVSAFWMRGANEYSFVQVGSTALINIGPGR